MTLNTNLTENELTAALVLVQTCLNGMGGSRPIDLDNDPYTWVDAKDLMINGWSAAQANGTLGALMDKGFVSQYDNKSWVLEEEAYRYLDTIWTPTTSEMENATVTQTSFIALIDLTAAVVEFAVDMETAEASDALVVTQESDLETLTGPQAVAIYNNIAFELPKVSQVKRFADKQTAMKRVWMAITEFAKLHAQPAGRDVVGKIVPVVEVEAPVAEVIPAAAVAVEVAAANERIAAVKTGPAKRTDIPKPAPGRKTGINLPATKKAYACREGSKQALMVDLLSRAQGASMKELLEGLSGGSKPWKEVTVKSGLNWDMNKIKGYGIRTTYRQNGEPAYRLVLPAGMQAPIPHTLRVKKDK